MLTTYFLIFLLFSHILFFKKIIFKWSVFGVFLIATFIFSGVGIFTFPFIKEYLFDAFLTFKMSYISNSIVVKTQIIFTIGILITLYSYVLSLLLFQNRIVGISHITFQGKIKDNLSKSNFYFILLVIFLFLGIYLFIKRDVLIMGIFDGLIGRKPQALLFSRRSITSSFLYVIITYNLLPFLTMVTLYLAYKRKTLTSKLLFYITFIISFLLILLLFQKRPLIIFLLSFAISNYIFRKKLKTKKKKRKLTKKQLRRKYILYGVFLFTLLITLYYAGTTYQFDNIFEAVLKLTEVALLRVFGRLAIPPFFYVHHFPEIRPYYGITNIGTLSKVLRFEFFPDTAVLFDFYSKKTKGGSLAINTIFDFYGAFGYYGLVVGSAFLGLFLSALDSFLHKLEKNGINLIFTIFCFVFAYYLTQANFARSLMGYGFLFFIMTWMFLQKRFKIKLR